MSVAAGYFVLRTPLVPVDEFVGAVPDRLLVRPPLEQAIGNASPSLYRAVRENPSRPGVRHSLIRYLGRAAMRPVPFGLLAGWSTGRIGQVTRLEWAAERRVTRLDADSLPELAAALARRWMRGLSYRPNPSLYRAGGRLRYMPSPTQLAAVAETQMLSVILRRADGGATWDNLVAAAVEQGVEAQQAQEFVEAIVDGGLLVSELALPMIGPEPSEALLERLRSRPEAAPVIDVLEYLRDELQALDATWPDGAEDRYDALLDRFEKSLPIRPRLRVDLLRPAPGLTLGEPVVAEIARGAALVWRLGSPGAEAHELARFRRAFAERYGRRAVGLAEVLDPEIGLGFPVGGAEPAGGLAWSAREQWLLDRLMAGSRELVFAEADLETLPAAAPPPAFAARAALAADSTEALDAGEFEILMLDVRGPSSGALLGRLAGVDAELRERLRAQCEQEAACAPDAELAEIALSAGDNSANVVHRPRLRGHELGEADLGRLTLALEDDELVLARDGRRVHPRFASAHTPFATAGAYRFLCALAGNRAVQFQWGPALELRPFLPRLRCGRVVLRPAQWRLGRSELHNLAAGGRRAVEAWRGAHDVPRLVELLAAGSALAFDLDDNLGVDALLALISKRESAILAELWPVPERMPAHGPTGRFRHDLIVPFVPTEVVREPPRQASPLGARRIYGPGSDWLYAKVYTSPAEADRILSDVVAPLASLADRWFFVRYADPDSHIRLRFHGEPEVLGRQILPELQSLLDVGRAHRVTLDSYEPEVERYGGEAGIDRAEAIFHVDSEAVLALLASVGRDDQMRRRVARLSLRRLLEDLRDDPRPLIARRRIALRSEFGDEAGARRSRHERSDVPTSVQAVLRRRSERLVPLADGMAEEVAISHAHMHINRLVREDQRRVELELFGALDR